MPSLRNEPWLTIRSPGLMPGLEAPRCSRRGSIEVTPHARELLDRDRGRRAAHPGRGRRDLAALVRADHRAVLALVGDLAHVGEVLGDERDPERIAGQQRDGADLARRDADVELPDVATDGVLVEDRVAHGQDWPSLAYGRPTAAGATLRPTTPARMTIVTMYGSAPYTCDGIASMIAPEVGELGPGRPDADRLAEGAGVGEQQRAGQRADGRPAAEDDRRQRDEAAAGGHAVLERAGPLEGEVCARQPGEDAGEDDVAVAQPDDVDADRVGGTRVLAHRAGPQSPSRAEEQDLQDEHEDDHRHRDRSLLEEHLDQPADDRDVDDLLAEGGTSRTFRRPRRGFGEISSRLK